MENMAIAVVKILNSHTSRIGYRYFRFVLATIPIEPTHRPDRPHYQAACKIWWNSL